MPNDALLTALERAVAGSHDVLGELGAGGMASVFAARDRALDRVVAVKVMAPELLAAPGMVDRFMQEARTVAQLRHPNIVTVHQVGVAAGLHFFVMEYLDGATLRDLLDGTDRRRALDVAERVRILRDVAGALQYAHDRGIVHRDVKPANVLVCTDGRVVVTDFGIARAMRAPGLTAPGMVIGTPDYMSPEHCLEAEELTGAADQYSLGVIAYEMLAGRRPFEGAQLAVLHAHVAQPAPPLPDGAAGPALRAAVARMLAKRPEERFPTVAEAGAALAAAAAQDATQDATHDATQDATRRSTTDARRRWLVGAATVAALAAGGAAALRASGDASPAPAASPATPLAPPPAGPPPPRPDSVALLRADVARARSLSEGGDYAAAAAALAGASALGRALAVRHAGSPALDSATTELLAARAENAERCAAYARLLARRGRPAPACD